MSQRPFFHSNYFYFWCISTFINYAYSYLRFFNAGFTLLMEYFSAVKMLLLNYQHVSSNSANKNLNLQFWIFWNNIMIILKLNNEFPQDWRYKIFHAEQKIKKKKKSFFKSWWFLCFHPSWRISGSFTLKQIAWTYFRINIHKIHCAIKINKRMIQGFYMTTVIFYEYISWWI